MAAAPLLGLDASNKDQCLVSAVRTKDGTVLPAGTRGTMNREKSGRTTFIVDTGSDPKPKFHDLTGQSYHMKSCN